MSPRLTIILKAGSWVREVEFRLLMESVLYQISMWEKVSKSYLNLKVEDMFLNDCQFHFFYFYLDIKTLEKIISWDNFSLLYHFEGCFYSQGIKDHHL